jgi:hypothetical protein
MKKSLVTLLLIGIFFANGCSLFETQKPNPTQFINLKADEDLRNASSKIDENTKIIEEKSDNIIKESTSIQENVTEASAKVPEDSKAVIVPHLDSIKESSKTIINDAISIEKANIDLGTAKELIKNAEDKVVTTNKLLEKLVDERDNALEREKIAIEKKDSQMHRMLQWLIVACIVGVGVSIVVFFMSGSKLGIAGAAACGVILVVAIAIEAYFIYFAIAGGILLIGVIGILIYDAWEKRKALKEVVDTVEVTKDNLLPEVKEKLFGAGDDNGLMKKIQSSSTMRIVKNTKKKLPNLWDYARENKKGNLNGGST